MMRSPGSILRKPGDRFCYLRAVQRSFNRVRRTQDSGYCDDTRLILMTAIRFITYCFHAVAALAFIVAAAPTLSAQPTGPSQPVILEFAENLKGQGLSSGEEKIELIGNVKLRQGLVNITADRAIYFTAGDRAQLFGNVRIVQPGVVITAPETDYNGTSGIATTPKGIVITEDSGTLEAGYGEYHMNRRISYFRQGVKLYDSNVVVKAVSGVYYSLERKAIFQGDVNAVSDSGTLTSQELTYWRDSRKSFAVGDVRLESLQDSSILICDTLQNQPGKETFAFGNVDLLSIRENARLTGDTLRHFPERDYTIVTGSPQLVQIDTATSLYVPDSSTVASSDTSEVLATRPDTLHRGDSILSVRRDTTVISATVLERFSGDQKEIRATGDARMRRGTLEAIGTIARYFEDEEIVSLGSGRPAENPVTGDSPVASDSGDVVDTSDSLEQITGAPSDTSSITNDSTGTTPIITENFVDPVVWYDDSQLTGDTITVFLAKKKLRLIEVDGNAFAISRNDIPERYDQLASERLLFNVADDTVRSVRAEGSAASIYFIYDGAAPNGLNRSSGDTIVISFEEGKASRVGIYGPRSPLEGEVIPEKDVAGQERLYRLSGFDWLRTDQGAVTSDKDQTPESNKSEDESASDARDSEPSGTEIPE